MYLFRLGAFKVPPLFLALSNLIMMYLGVVFACFLFWEFLVILESVGFWTVSIAVSSRSQISSFRMSNLWLISPSAFFSVFTMRHCSHLFFYRSFLNIWSIDKIIVLIFLAANSDIFGSSWLVLTIDFSHGRVFLLFVGVVILIECQAL